MSLCVPELSAPQRPQWTHLPQFTPDLAADRQHTNVTKYRNESVSSSHSVSSRKHPTLPTGMVRTRARATSPVTDHSCISIRVAQGPRVAQVFSKHTERKDGGHRENGTRTPAFLRMITLPLPCLGNEKNAPEESHPGVPERRTRRSKLIPGAEEPQLGSAPALAHHTCALHQAQLISPGLCTSPSSLVKPCLRLQN